MCFCVRTKSKHTGINSMRDPIAVRFQAVKDSLLKIDSPIVIVRISSELVAIKGHRNSFIWKTKVNNPRTVSAGLHCGRTI